MKATITAILTSLSLICFCQTNAPAGLGPFKIGQTTTDIINQVKTEIGYYGNPLPFTSSESLRLLGELLVDTVEYQNDDPNLLTIPGARVFKITTYKIAGTSISDLYLSFYNDTLVKITVGELSAQNVCEAFELKYDKGVKKEKAVADNCRNGASEKSEIWTNGNIESKYYNHFYHSSDCHIKIDCFFSISLKPVCEKLAALQKIELAKLDKEKIRKKKQSLSGF